MHLKLTHGDEELKAVKWKFTLFLFSRRDVPFGNGFAEPPERLYKIVRVAEKSGIKSLSEKLVLSDFKLQMNTDISSRHVPAYDFSDRF